MAESHRFCVAEMCAECRESADCSTDVPVCDKSSHACRGCQTDSECPSNVCDVDAAKCAAEQDVLYVVPTGGMTTCTQLNPCSLDRALEIRTATRNIIKLGPGAYSTSTEITVDGSEELTMIGPASIPGLTVLDAASFNGRDLTLDFRLLCVSEGLASVDLSRVVVGPGASVGGIACTMSIHESRVLSALTQIPAIHADGLMAGVNGATINRGSVLTVMQSEVVGSQVRVEKYSSLRMTNSVLREQGGLPAILLGENVLASEIAFTTIVDGTVVCGDGAPVLEGKNNIIVNTRADAPTNTVMGAACTHNYSLINPQAASPVGANNLLNLDPLFTNKVVGELQLLPQSPAIDAADPTATEPFDLVGTQRPQGPRHDVGAFEYKQ